MSFCNLGFIKGDCKSHMSKILHWGLWLLWTFLSSNTATPLPYMKFSKVPGTTSRLPCPRETIITITITITVTSSSSSSSHLHPKTEEVNIYQTLHSLQITLTYITSFNPSKNPMKYYYYLYLTNGKPKQNTRFWKVVTCPKSCTQKGLESRSCQTEKWSMPCLQIF